MVDTGSQPISFFSKTNHLYRILDMLSLPATTNAMQEIITHCMRNQAFHTPTSMIQWFSDTLNVSERTIKTGFADLDAKFFLVNRKTKSCVVNPYFANKCEFVTGHMQRIIVDARACSDTQIGMIEKVNIMRTYNHARSPHLQTIDQMAQQFAQSTIANERIKRLEARLDNMQSVVDYLSSRASEEDAAKARSMIRLVRDDEE